jgi:hypothetical protein
MQVRKGIDAIAVVLIGLLGVTGCGGDSSSLSKAEYHQQLELVCNEGLQAREEFLINSNKEAEHGKKVGKAEGIRRYIGVYEDTTEKIADLNPPEQTEKLAEEYVQAREAAAAKAYADPISAVANSLIIFKKANDIAEDDLEVGSCAK